MSSNHGRRGDLVSRACDRCKSRKSKCSGSRPCHQCVAAVTECTFLAVQRMRGPPKSRVSKSIIKSRKGPTDPLATGRETGMEKTPIPSPRFRPRIAVSALRPMLESYRASMFSVWPIVDTDELLSRLHGECVLFDYALALATAAATIGQLNAAVELPGQCPSASQCEAECQRVRYALQSRNDTANLTWLRVAFFLHAYHENRDNGSVKSLLYLREAISLAQYMGLHNEASYINVPASEVSLRKRIFWLLFITERGNSIFHHLPVLLAPNIQPHTNNIVFEPPMMEPLEIIVQIFAAIDRSGLCRSTKDANEVAFEGFSRLNAFNGNLQWSMSILGYANDINRADIFVTVCWARVLLWKAAQPAITDSSFHDDGMSTPLYPLTAAEDMISSLEAVPSTAIEAHGVGIVKIFNIASTLIEHAADLSHGNDTSGMLPDQRYVLVLKKLHHILASIKDGDKQLLCKLFDNLLGTNSIGARKTPLGAEEFAQIWEGDGDDMIVSGRNIVDPFAIAGLMIEPPEDVSSEWGENSRYADELFVSDMGFDTSLNFLI